MWSFVTHSNHVERNNYSTHAVSLMSQTYLQGICVCLILFNIVSYGIICSTFACHFVAIPHTSVGYASEKSI